jgi:hypothetical protein
MIVSILALRKDFVVAAFLIVAPHRAIGRVGYE